MYDNEDAATILALHPVETNPKLCLRKSDIKQHVYNTNLGNNIEILKPDITEAVNSAADMIHNVYKEFVRKAKKCIDVEEYHAE
ncbi:hypothetical protein QE152_g38419 [Popillia japonica]|uniref:Uncharacterized protein n=1 Tax=Popillia japonica TaxID=7064 RepID=A0AAW1HX47_POPJA